MKFWYGSDWRSKSIAGLLSPLSIPFWLVTKLRRQLYQNQILTSYRAAVPILVVGNLSVGGNGKTPLVIWLVKQLSQRGFKVGVISRGYGRNTNVKGPQLVLGTDDPAQMGDEPVLIAKRTSAPVCVDANRQQAIELLLNTHPLDLIISDDGLQHYRMQRDYEIVVIDSQRVLGNGLPLPAGPLRELSGRLAEVDLVVANGDALPISDAEMKLVAQNVCNLKTGEQRPLNHFVGQSIIAMAAIGNPKRFFTMLKQQGLDLKACYEFSDHYQFKAEDFAQFDSSMPLLMTEKDAVKCTQFAQSNYWYVPVEAEINSLAMQQLLDKISNHIKENHERKTA